MDYSFAALMGAPYRGGSLVMHDDVLLSAAGNRVTEVRLVLNAYVSARVGNAQDCKPPAAQELQPRQPSHSWLRWT